MISMMWKSRFCRDRNGSEANASVRRVSLGFVLKTWKGRHSDEDGSGVTASMHCLIVFGGTGDEYLLCASVPACRIFCMTAGFATRNTDCERVLNGLRLTWTTWRLVFYGTLGYTLKPSMIDIKLV